MFLNVLYIIIVWCINIVLNSGSGHQIPSNIDIFIENYNDELRTLY